jgi:hypothetical protein
MRATVCLSLMLLTACPRKVPDHLRVEPDPVVAPSDGQPAAPADPLAQLVGRDPLVRSPSLPEAEQLEGVEGREALLEFVQEVNALEQGEGQAERSMQQLEVAWPRSPVVALSRGYRLRVAENLLGNQALPKDQRDSSLLGLITPLQPAPDGASLNRAPLAWLVTDGPADPQVRAYAERWVLQGWMAAPEIDRSHAAAALRADMYDGLRRTPTAALLLARDEGADADPAAGLAALQRATHLALEQAAADRDREQAAWSDTRAAAAEELGVDDPVLHLLQVAVTELTAAAGDDAAAGGALLALSAMRWRNTCDDAPCRGVDRVSTMAAARRYGEPVDALGHIWQVIALKEAIDTMEVAHDTVMYPEGSLALVDAVLGTGGGPLDDATLRKRRPDAGVWLAISRAVGEEGVTAWEGARAALGQHLKNEAEDARAAVDDEAIASLLERISRRAIP